MEQLAFGFHETSPLSNASASFPITVIQSVDNTYVPGYKMSHTARFLFVKLQTGHKQTTSSRPFLVL